MTVVRNVWLALLAFSYPALCRANIFDGNPEVVVISGDAGTLLPGSGERLLRIGELSMDALGNIAFKGNDDIWVWERASRQLRKVAGEAEEAPGTNGLVFRSIDEPWIWNGKVAFRATVGTNSDWTVWQEKDNGLALVAREGDPASEGDIFLSFDQPYTIHNGAAVFAASVTPTSGGFRRDRAIFTFSEGALRLVAQGGKEIPGGLGDYGSNFYLTVDPYAGIAFTTSLVEPTSRRWGVFRLAPEAETPELVSSGHEPLSGIDGGVISSSSKSRPGLGSSGHITFAGGIWESALGYENGLFLLGDGDAIAIAHSQQSAPGLDNVEFESLFWNIEENSPFTDALGRSAFFAHTDLPPDFSGPMEGLWFGGPDSVSLIALRGSVAPGQGMRWNDFDRPFVSQAGHLIFSADTISSDGELYGKGIWITDLGGEIHTVAETGSAIQIQGDQKVVTSVSLGAGHPGIDLRLRPMNAAGQLAYIVGTNSGEFLMTRSVRPPTEHDQLQLRYSDGLLGVTIQSLAGHDYQLQESINLQEGDWISVGEPIAGTNGVLFIPWPSTPAAESLTCRLLITAR